jgi:hypothetical protein
MAERLSTSRDARWTWDGRKVAHLPGRSVNNIQVALFARFVAIALGAYRTRKVHVSPTFSVVVAKAAPASSFGGRQAASGFVLDDRWARGCRGCREE